MDWMRILPWLALASGGRSWCSSCPMRCSHGPTFDGIYERFRKEESRLWRAKGGPGHLRLLPNHRPIGRISRLLHDLDGVSDPELVAQANALRGWARYETYVLAPLFLVALLSGLAWATLRQ